MIRTIIISVTILIVALLTFMIIISLFYSSQVDSWLSVNEPVEADVLILEGWTSPAITAEVAREFSEGNYNTLITTGGPLDEVYNMTNDGMIRFDLEAAGVTWDSGDTVALSLWAFGEPAMGEYARYTIIHRKDTIGRGYTDGQMKLYRHHYIVGENPSGEIFVIYDNDFITRDEDRNLHVWKLETGGVTIPVRSDYTRLIRRVGSGTLNRPLYQTTLAQEKTFQLIMAGVDSNRIIALEVPSVKRLRTYTDAVMVNEWFRETGMTPAAVNLFSQGNHARRSRLLYRYAMTDSIEVGVISSEPDESGHRHFRFLDLDLSTMRELGAYLYTRVFFCPRRNYRRIIDAAE